MDIYCNSMMSTSSKILDKTEPVGQIQLTYQQNLKWCPMPDKKSGKACNFKHCKWA